MNTQEWGRFILTANGEIVLSMVLSVAYCAAQRVRLPRNRYMLKFTETPPVPSTRLVGQCDGARNPLVDHIYVAKGNPRPEP